MRYIIAVIQPNKLSDVLEKLEEKGIHLVTVTEVMGHGRQKGVGEVYRSHTENGTLLRKIKLEIAVNDEFLSAAINSIKEGAYSGNIGDGKIFVLDLMEVLRIRTGDTGKEAIG